MKEKPQILNRVNARTAYFRNFKYLSAFSGILTLNGISFPAALNRSCIAPNEQMNPQKKRPQTRVIRKVPSIRTILPKLSARTKLSFAIVVMSSPIDENMVTNRAGAVIKAVS